MVTLGVVPANTDIGSIDVEFIDDPNPKFNKASVKGPGVVSLTGAATAILSTFLMLTLYLSASFIASPNTSAAQ